MENQPTLHQDQQNQADQAVKAEGLKETNPFIKRDEVIDDRELSEEEKAQRSKPEDFEKFNFDQLDEEHS
ncbi:hypothetical protein GCM10008932_04780 [Alkalibacterium iburiense]|uniref:YfhD family protein n=1 Tax=Alkalibacterium iburiense TaxID=290589 RepID=A0ABN0X4B2_9LACT